METAMEEGEESYPNQDEERDITRLCRVCANPNEYLIPIYHGEGLEHDLKAKISRHLPIKVQETDCLPLQLCYQCASTLIAWHDMVTGCSEADAKLRALLPHDQAQLTLDEKTGAQVQQQVSKESTKDSQGGNNALRTEFTGQDVSDEVTMGDEMTHQRFLDSFSVYLQNQVALKKLQWTLSGALFCLYCGQFKSNFPDFLKHLKIIHSFQCTQCQARFTGKVQLLVHQAVHDEISSIGVETEDATPMKVLRKSKRKISRPIKFKTDEGSQLRTAIKRFRCDLCPLLFVKKCYLDQHKRQSHSQTEKDTQNERKSRQCTLKKENDIEDDDEMEDFFVGADVSFNDDSDIDEVVTQHLNAAQLDPNPDADKPADNYFPCQYCDYVGTKKKSLAAHKGREHKTFKIRRNKPGLARINDPFLENSRKYIDGVRFFECQICGKKNRTPHDFRRHFRTHSTELPFTCHQCGKGFKELTYLTKHINSVHEKIKRYNCDICGRAFAEKKACSDHRRTHTGEKPFVCEICGKAFKTHTSIYCHRRIHVDYRPHQCTTCEKRFRTKQRLEDHIRIHTGQRPYTCPICYKSFRVRGELCRHVGTHSVERPHVCHECGASFTLKRYLKQHSRTHAYVTVNDGDSESAEPSTLYVL